MPYFTFNCSNSDSKADTPYGYIVVDHKNKTVFKGGEFISIKELLQFEDAATRFAKIKQTKDDLLADNPKLTTADINRILYRQFGTRIHRGTVKWNDQIINLKPEVQEQLYRNNRVAMGLPPTPRQYIGHTLQKPQEYNSSRSNTAGNNINNSAGSSDTNREWELKGGMSMDVDNAETIKRKW